MVSRTTVLALGVLALAGSAAASRDLLGKGGKGLGAAGEAGEAAPLAPVKVKAAKAPKLPKQKPVAAKGAYGEAGGEAAVPVKVSGEIL